ncbi:MAG: acetate--CoA ligase family protein [Deltaproteobacteria bacterium]|nr:acetate--CoA ligase family protein [Deltaproteobacteria bacterium]
MSLSFFHSLMNPESIAIVGANNNPMKMGTMHALSIIEDGFKGEFYPLHPSEQTVLGRKAYARPSDLPKPPDLAIFVLPAQHLLPVFEEFGKIGTRYAIVITAGFKELGPEGIKEEQRLKKMARNYDMRFLGPNCMGIMNREISLNTTVMPLLGKPGNLGMISQSGTYVSQTMPYLQKRGIYFSKAVSVGNEADISIVDVLEYLGEDDSTKAIAIYIEMIRDVRRFLDVARKITPNKPVIVQYVGGSEAGGRSGASHTGAMAGKDFLYDGLFKQAGIIRAHSIEDLYGWGWALASQPGIKGKRIGIITNSGGPGSAIADTCETGGCEVPPFSTDLQEKIKPLVPAHAPCGNPVDLTFSTDMEIMTHKITDHVMKSREVDGIVLHGAVSSGFMSAIFPHVAKLLPGLGLADMLQHNRKDLSDTVRLPFNRNIPMTVSSFFDRDDEYTRAYQDNGVPVFDSPEKAARAMAAMVAYKKITDRKPYASIPIPEAIEIANRILSDAQDNKQKSIDEYAAKRLLSCYGIPTPVEQIVNSAEEAAGAARKIGFPVAIKACDPDILHKSEHGLVHLNIAGALDTINAFQEIQRACNRPVSVLVSQMVTGKREFLAGITYDEQFGHCVAFGVGGIFTEAINDVTYRVAPIAMRDAEEMINDVKTSRLLEPCRGMPAVDRHALADVLVRLSLIPLIHPRIREIDMNPLIISGAKPVAVDAVILLQMI